jgi:hypothetical protein
MGMHFALEERGEPKLHSLSPLMHLLGSGRPHLCSISAHSGCGLEESTTGLGTSGGRGGPWVAGSSAPSRARIRRRAPHCHRHRHEAPLPPFLHQFTFAGRCPTAARARRCDGDDGCVVPPWRWWRRRGAGAAL